MIIPVVPEAYDAVGRPTPLLLGKAKRRFGSTFPVGRYLSGKLSVRCASLGELRTFLRGCRYVSDQEKCGRADYWMPPEEFELRKQGDCDDYALWVWRQLMIMGYDV